MVGMQNSDINSQLHGDPIVSGPDDKRKLILNYLPHSMTEDEIKFRFSSIGDIESVRLMKDKITGQSLGYAFVNYRASTDAAKAINAFNGMPVLNKTIKVSYARPSSEAIIGSNLYICGLPKDFTLTDLENLFKPFGTIISSKIQQGNQTPGGSGHNNVVVMSRGIGFIRYSLRSEAEEAIKELNGTVPKGSIEPIVVKFANPTNKSGNTPFNHRMPAGGTHRIGFPPPHPGSMMPPPYNMGPPPIPQRNNFMVRPKHPTVGNYRFNPMSIDPPGNSMFPNNAKNVVAGFHIFVYNLPPETEETLLWKLFGPYGAVLNARLMLDLQTKKCKGYGFVTMANRDEAEIAVRSLNGYNLGNRVLQVSFKTNKNRNM